MKNFGEKVQKVRRLGFWENFGRVWLLLEVNGMEIVLGLFIGWENRVTFGQKRVTTGFCNGQKFEEPPKSCHDWVKTWHDPPFSNIYCPEIVSRFGQRVTI